MLDCINEIVPFQPGDLVRFVSNANDTLSFTCNNREFFTEPGTDFDSRQQECCKAYKIENFRCSFEPEGENIFAVSNDNLNVRKVYCGITIDDKGIFGRWYFDDDCSFFQFGEKLDSINLAGKVFHEVYTPEDGDTIYLEPTSLGIVGFILDGKEWRVL